MILKQGDCLELMGEIQTKSVDLILCDLPYGKTKCEWDKILPFDALWKQYTRIIKENGAIVLFGVEPFASALRLSNLKMYKYDWVWDKGTHSSPLLAKKQPLRTTERLLVFYKKQPIYNPQMTEGKPYKKDYGYGAHKTDTLGDKVALKSNDNTSGLRYPTQIIRIGQPKNNRKYHHPTQKPVALLEYIIRTYTTEGDTVLDNCMGSGSTGVACISTNRRFIGMEKNESFFNLAKLRIEEYKSIKENK